VNAAKFVSENASKMSICEMATKLHISKAEVRALFERTLHPQPDKTEQESEKTEQEPEKAEQKPEKTEQKKRTCRHFTADEDRQLIALRENNETLRVIAAKLGRPEGSVFNRLRRIYAEM
jgi:hypothetical protein